jgi:hypothetical protein
MRHPEPRRIDDRDIAKDTARDLAEIASHIGKLKGDANTFLKDLNLQLFDVAGNFG